MLQLETFIYNKNTWSVPIFPNLDSERTLVFVFAAPKFKELNQPIQELLNFYTKSKIIGCSTAGEIYQNSVKDDTIVVAVAKFEHTDLHIIHTEVTASANSYSAGQKIAKELLKNNLKHIFILSDGINVNGTELVNGIVKGVPKDVNITGGLAGDGDRFQSTWTLDNSGILTKSVIAAGFYGSHLKVAYASQGGWDTFGPERTITKSQNNILYEIDDQPALTLYKTYLGDHALRLPAAALLFPLAIRLNSEEKNSIVRTVLSIDENNQTMTFAGDMPQNWLAQLMTANFDRLVEGASNAGNLARIEGGSGDILTLAISCVGRKLVLGEQVDEEVEATLEKLPPKTKQIGFYSYGEICPSGVTNCDLHNQTMTLTTLTET